MENAERLVAKAYEWVDQAAHELQWEDTYTATRKGEWMDRIKRRGRGHTGVISSRHERGGIEVQHSPDVRCVSCPRVGWCWMRVHSSASSRPTSPEENTQDGLVFKYL